MFKIVCAFVGALLQSQPFFSHFGTFTGMNQSLYISRGQSVLLIQHSASGGARISKPSISILLQYLKGYNNYGVNKVSHLKFIQGR